FHLLDLSAIVVGYGLASLLVRGFWPTGEPPGAAVTAAIGVVYLWLGLAMSGPLVLLVGRRAAAAPEEEARPAPRRGRRPGRRGPEADISPGAAPRTWAELAWLITGFYWIGLTVLVVPVRLDRSPFATAIVGLVPILAALLLLVVGPPGHR